MKVTVRWWDGYIEVFRNVVEWRAGAYLLWIKYEDRGISPMGPVLLYHYRHIPLSQVRWFEPLPDEMLRDLI